MLPSLSSHAWQPLAELLGFNLHITPSSGFKVPASKSLKLCPGTSWNSNLCSSFAITTFTSICYEEKQTVSDSKYSLDCSCLKSFYYLITLLCQQTDLEIKCYC